jgi:hypothetical protein
MAPTVRSSRPPPVLRHKKPLGLPDNGDEAPDSRPNITSSEVWAIKGPSITPKSSSESTTCQSFHTAVEDFVDLPPSIQAAWSDTITSPNNAVPSSNSSVTTVIRLGHSERHGAPEHNADSPTSSETASLHTVTPQHNVAPSISSTISSSSSSSSSSAVILLARSEKLHRATPTTVMVSLRAHDYNTASCGPSPGYLTILEKFHQRWTEADDVLGPTYAAATRHLPVFVAEGEVRDILGYVRKYENFVRTKEVEARGKKWALERRSGGASSGHSLARTVRPAAAESSINSSVNTVRPVVEGSSNAMNSNGGSGSQGYCEQLRASNLGTGNAIDAELPRVRPKGALGLNF